MEEIMSLLNTIPNPYSDLVAVAVIFGIIVLISLILSFFFEQKPDEASVPAEAEAVPEAAPPEPVEAPPAEPAPKPETAPQEVTGEPPPAEDFRTPGEEATETGVTEEPEAVRPEEPVTEIGEEVEVAASGEQEVITEEVPETKEGLFARLRSGLSKTNRGLFGRLTEIVSRRELDEELWEEFEETLIMADIGVSTTMKLRERVEEKLAKHSMSDASEVTGALKEEILGVLSKAEGRPLEADTHPFVVMVAGVNGVGKTTTIGKLANRLKSEGRSVMVAAGDTFRAAAMEQLEVWSKRVGTEFLKGTSGQDPSSVAFDATKAAVSRGIDVLIIDTAGRLHTKGNLMDELKKMKRVVGRELEGAPHETLLVLDATTGQNAIQQAKLFNEALDVTGIVLTKLDGTAKGGVIIAIAEELNIPVKYIGIGESLSDLREFEAEEFVEALFYPGDETLH